MLVIGPQGADPPNDSSPGAESGATSATASQRIDNSDRTGYLPKSPPAKTVALASTRGRWQLMPTALTDIDEAARAA